MKIVTGSKGREAALIALFASTFTDAEGEAEGAAIKDMVAALLSGTPVADIYVFSALKGNLLTGAGIFTRLSFPQDSQSVFILSPMAVAPSEQGQGIGQRLLQDALGHLRRDGVDVAMTYGDPAFYRKVGFRAVTVQQVHPPLPLSMPYGWIGQNLKDGTVPALQGPSVCVTGLNRPAIW